VTTSEPSLAVEGKTTGPGARRRLLLALLVPALAAPVLGGALARLVLPGLLDLTPGGVAALEARLRWLVPSGALIAVLLVGRTEARVRPLLRGSVRALREGIPPSRAATADLLDAPNALLRFQVAWVLTYATLEALDLLPGTGVDPATARSIAAGIAGGVGLLILPATVAWRAILRRVLEPFPPALVWIPLGHTLACRTAILAGTGIGALGLLGISAALAVGGAHALAPLPLSAAVLWVGLMGVLAARSAHRRARLDARALHLLAERVEAAQTAEDAAAVGRGIDGPLVEVLAGKVAALGRRYRDVARDEDLARRSLEELLVSKTRFMASMSHDLRSPLNSILGFSELLLSGADGSLPAPQRESLRAVQRSGRDLLEVLNDVLDAARLDAGRLPLRRAWTPSVEILTEALAKGRELANERNIEVVSQVQPGLPPVWVDRDRVVQAVVCLFRHLARAMDGGVLRLFAGVGDDGRGGRQLRVDLVDEHGEIRDADRERLFQAFRAVKGPRGRRVGGLGLSLSLARSLARAHDGDVWFENDPARGTVFSVGIPVAGPDTPEVGG